MKSFLNILTVCILTICLSCTDKLCDKASKDVSLSNLLNGITTSLQLKNTPESLNPDEYVTWVKEQKGITYNTVSSDQFRINLIFNPPQLEAYTAAVTNGENPKTALAKYLNVQKEFYYCTAECVIKSESASNPIKKTDLLQALKQQLMIVKNNRDTLSGMITEAFPSYVMNQPNKLLILIPNTDLSSYRITVKGAAFKLDDCELNLSKETIKSFPFIKL